MSTREHRIALLRVDVDACFGVIESWQIAGPSGRVAPQKLRAALAAGCAVRFPDRVIVPVSPRVAP